MPRTPEIPLLPLADRRRTVAARSANARAAAPDHPGQATIGQGSRIFLDANPARRKAVSRYWSTILAAWGVAAGVVSELVIRAGLVGVAGITERWLIRGAAVAIALFVVIPALRRVGRQKLGVTARLLAVGSLVAAFAAANFVLGAVLGGR